MGRKTVVGILSTVILCLLYLCYDYSHSSGDISLPKSSDHSLISDDKPIINSSITTKKKTRTRNKTTTTTTTTTIRRKTKTIDNELNDEFNYEFKYDLSILVATRNDGYGSLNNKDAYSGGMYQRLKRCIQQIALFNWYKYNPDLKIEFVIVEFNNIIQNPDISEINHIKNTLKNTTLIDIRFIKVSQNQSLSLYTAIYNRLNKILNDDTSFIRNEWVKFFNNVKEGGRFENKGTKFVNGFNAKGAPLKNKNERNEKWSPFYEYIAKNVGLRRLNGKFVLITNQDDLMSNMMLTYISRHIRNDKIFNNKTVFVSPQQHYQNDIFAKSKLSKQVNCPCKVLDDNKYFNNNNNDQLIDDNIIDEKCKFNKWTGWTGSSGDFILIPHSLINKYGPFLELPMDWGLDSEFMSRMAMWPQIEDLYINITGNTKINPYNKTDTNDTNDIDVHVFGPSCSYAHQPHIHTHSKISKGALQRNGLGTSIEPNYQFAARDPKQGLKQIKYTLSIFIDKNNWGLTKLGRYGLNEIIWKSNSIKNLKISQQLNISYSRTDNIFLSFNEIGGKGGGEKNYIYHENQYFDDKSHVICNPYNNKFIKTTFKP